MAARIIETDAEKRERNGVRFVMRDGPADGMIFRLYPSPYLGQNERDGWDQLPWPSEGGRYVRPDDVDPHMEKKAPNKARTNIPHMVWEATATTPA